MLFCWKFWAVPAKHAECFSTPGMWISASNLKSLWFSISTAFSPWLPYPEQLTVQKCFIVSIKNRSSGIIWKDAYMVTCQYCMSVFKWSRAMKNVYLLLLLYYKKCAFGQSHFNCAYENSFLCINFFFLFLCNLVSYQVA